MSILNVEHLTHGFGDRAIFQDVSFRLLKGEHKLVNTTTIATNPNFCYKFYYKYDDTVVEYSFNADVNFDKLLTHFKRFCQCCSWEANTVERIIPKDEEEY